jgi:hypothetical protein
MIKIDQNVYKAINLVTLALGLRPRQGQGCKPRGRLGSHITWSRECKECEGMNPHTPNWTPMLGVGIPNGLLNLQSAIAGVKTHRLEKFFLSLEIYWSVYVWNGLASSIWTSKTQVMAKRKPCVKLAIWFPTSKRQKSTQFPCVQVACDISLESSQQGLQIFFRPHCNQRFSREVIRPQSCRIPSCGNFGTPTWESWDKKPFGCGPRGKAQSIL